MTCSCAGKGCCSSWRGCRWGRNGFPPGSSIGRLVSKLRRRYNREGETNIIPYEAILRVDEEVLVIRT